MTNVLPMTPEQIAKLPGVESRPCIACGAPLLIVPGVNEQTGKAIKVPLDARRHDIRYVDGQGRMNRCVEGFFVNHWATCPNWKQMKESLK